jgi:hypothetical protein
MSDLWPTSSLKAEPGFTLPGNGFSARALLTGPTGRGMGENKAQTSTIKADEDVCGLEWDDSTSRT